MRILAEMTEQEAQSMMITEIWRVWRGRGRGRRWLGRGQRNKKTCLSVLNVAPDSSVTSKMML
jgi:hypothetical protein